MQELSLSIHGTPLDAGAEPRSPAGERSHLKLGRYEVVRELGKGAMGIVYLAKDPLIGRLVALKTIRPAAHADDDDTKEFQQRFVREAQAAGILNHPAIVTVHDIGQDETTGVSFIAMEYVEGQNLKEILAQGKTLSFDQVGDIIAQIADALDFAHSKGIIHRDVKPANIILLEGNRAKIMDFGIAKIASGAANLTSTGQFLGTPNYMAPEQIKGAPVDGRTDIFSLGICLYECLTRRKPFGGDSLTSISYKIVHEPFPSLHEINPQIPDGFDEVVGHALAKDPSKRYQRAKEFSSALRSVVRGEKPMKTEPMMEEETISTRDKIAIPTIEMPFPELGDVSAPSGPGQVSSVSTIDAKPAAKVAGQRQPLKKQLEDTFTRVRQYPGWRARISPPIFGAIIALLIIGLTTAVLAIQRQKPPVPKIDQRAEQRRLRERQLREEGNALLRQGRIHEAFVKFEQLNKMAPNSPAIGDMVQKLEAIRQKEELSKQQIAEARQKRDQGVELYNQKKFPEAIQLLQESFTMNPSDDQTANFLRLAQEEQQKIEVAKTAAAAAAKTRPSSGVATTTTTGTAARTGTVAPGSGRGISNAPAQLTTIFASPFNEGYIMVKVGADTVAHENLFEEKGRFLTRRNVPRTVNVTANFAPRNADVQVWVVVPSQKISDHQIIHKNFQPGTAHRLQVTFNQQSKTFDYQLN
ncbi:MAG TPA: serine/threonine-protein kinase [Thermoanaerobaculia bacterium]